MPFFLFINVFTTNRPKFSFCSFVIFNNIVCIFIGIKVPGKPGRPVFSRVSDWEVTLGWKPPDNDGRCRIIKYIVYYCSADVDLESLEKPKTAGRSKSCTFSKQLTFNKTYKFAVAAKNRFGVGPLSEFTECIKTPTRAGIVY